MNTLIATLEVGFDTTGFGPEESRVVVGDSEIAIAGGGPRGPLYGVYTFLVEPSIRDAQTLSRRSALEIEEKLLDIVHSSFSFRDPMDGALADAVGVGNSRRRGRRASKAAAMQA